MSNATQPCHRPPSANPQSEIRNPQFEPLYLLASLASRTDDPHAALREALSQAHALAARSVVVDGPEYLVSGSNASALAALVHELAMTARLDKSLHLNVNSAAPPSWAIQTPGPLFADPTRLPHPAVHTSCWTAWPSTS